MKTKITDWIKSNKIIVIGGVVVILALLNTCSCTSTDCAEKECSSCDVHVHDENCNH